MQGFVKSYWNQRHDVAHSRRIMYTFPPAKLPVLSTLAREFAVFNGWFASIPGPTLCNRAFAHYGTSFGHVGMEVWYANQQIKSIYERMLDEGSTAKVYYFDQASSSLEVVNLLQNQSRMFGTYAQFLADCQAGTLPDYVSSSRTTRTMRAPAACWWPTTSIPTITSAPASSSSPRSTTPSGRMRRSGKTRRCSSPTTSTAASSITCRRRSASRISSMRSPRRPPRARCSCSTGSACACRPC